MSSNLSRREAIVGFGATAAALGTGAFAEPPPAPDALDRFASFPRLDPKDVAEIVAKSHFDEGSVRNLVAAQPSLVNACWDWGFGDWETPLGAASHTGRRAIAEFLLERGARPDIFAAAMLGQTEVVKAFVTARPGVQRILGPHGIPLLAHAKAGGEKAHETFEYLKSLGDAGVSPESQPITDAERQKFTGTYALGTGANDRIEIKLDDRGLLIFQKAGGGSRIRMHYLGNNEFFPAGVPTTRLSFDLAKQPATLTVRAGESILVAARTIGP